MERPPLPPFTLETAVRKVRMAEHAWNSRDPVRVAQAYTVDTRWRNRKWQREREYRLTKELWAFHDNRIAVRFAYEWQDAGGAWTRSYGNENWEFDAYGLMRTRIASINDLPIREDERLFHWPLGPRPEGAASLSTLGL